MRRMSDGAREILTVTQELARSRGARECSAQDLAIAAVICRRLTLERNEFAEGGAQETTSPGVLGVGAALERCLGDLGAGELHVGELVELALSENPGMADYLR
ncbi:MULTISPECIES: hypothetical protein [Streptomyces]|uniref:Uncharacterized protein n=1 Tax=Streptomyces xanthii TaxID=2768069 RepID=A0A7H1BB96_9ACTN|nr:hypothetical protein [Streptomyces xanthii]QNS06001.1 hypothetical protein IAG42_22070 [Streptomyces xanthii]